MKKKQIYYRHGDVHLIEIDSIPKNAKATKDKIVEHGEVTGHAHRLNGNGATIFKAQNGIRYLKVVRPTDLSHEEHHTRTIPPGTYEIRRTRETDHMSGVIRQVAD
jgi:hypothetical protein